MHASGKGLEIDFLRFRSRLCASGLGLALKVTWPRPLVL